MAILVYRKGNKHKVHGIDCEFKRIDLREKNAHLAQGWLLSLGDLKDDGYTYEQLDNLHWKKLNKIFKECGGVANLDKEDKIKYILEAC